MSHPHIVLVKRCSHVLKVQLSIQKTMSPPHIVLVKRCSRVLKVQLSIQKTMSPPHIVIVKRCSRVLKEPATQTPSDALGLKGKIVASYLGLLQEAGGIRLSP
ncbi:hypothetical protein NP493_1781g00001 [Ridgeia piscesae]|uniref:Uncharacterized protein n=1 Tax=Ridgeia piscesae TaxID=27915 RepID=A0AAD9N685_RIDPI|nr:hypothetical protein NP493_1781g00001 [Ridgeia piscesae]